MAAESGDSLPLLAVCRRNPLLRTSARSARGTRKLALLTAGGRPCRPAKLRSWSASYGTFALEGTLQACKVAGCSQRAACRACGGALRSVESTWRSPAGSTKAVPPRIRQGEARRIAALQLSMKGRQPPKLTPEQRRQISQAGAAVSAERARSYGERHAQQFPAALKDSGGLLRQAVRTLNLAGVKGPRGGPLTLRTLQRVIRRLER